VCFVRLIDPPPAECVEEAICRTPGFWGTHACPLNEDGSDNCPDGAQNITRQVIEAAGGCLDVCGEVITNTAVNDANSALEAICVHVKGVSERQLARQLTAAALNNVISGGTFFPDLLSQCNSVCAGTGGTLTVEQCIFLVDCVNNGGDPFTVPGSCEPVEDSCHDRQLCNEDVGLCFDPPGRAGSPKACNQANKTDCTVIETGDPNEEDCEDGITEDTESCLSLSVPACPADDCADDILNACSGADCDGACHTLAEGGGLCIDGAFCGGLTLCPNGSSDCADGELCFVDTCCIDPVCIPVQCTVDGLVAAAVSGPTTAAR
jgi:hypothetical protein